MNCQQLGKFGRFLAHIHPGDPPFLHQHVRHINSLLFMGGLYQGAGEFAFRVGLPAKSGVGGGIVAVVPGIASIAVWSLGLNPQGNSTLGIMALEKLATALDWSAFSPVKTRR